MVHLQPLVQRQGNSNYLNRIINPYPHLIAGISSKILLQYMVTIVIRNTIVNPHMTQALDLKNMVQYRSDLPDGMAHVTVMNYAQINRTG